MKKCLLRHRSELENYFHTAPHYGLTLALFNSPVYQNLAVMLQLYMYFRTVQIVSKIILHAVRGKQGNK